MNLFIVVQLYVALTFTAAFERTQLFQVVDASTGDPIRDVHVTQMVVNDNMLASWGPKLRTLEPSRADGTVTATHVELGLLHHLFRFSKDGYSDATLQVGGGLLSDLFLGSPAEDTSPLKRLNPAVVVKVPLHPARRTAATKPASDRDGR